MPPLLMPTAVTFPCSSCSYHFHDAAVIVTTVIVIDVAVYTAAVANASVTAKDAVVVTAAAVTAAQGAVTVASAA